MIATTFIARIRARFTRTVDIAEVQCNWTVERQSCELKLVTDCEIFTRTVRLHDGRQSCPTCALIVPDLVADVQNSGLTNTELFAAGAVIGVDLDREPVWDIPNNLDPNGRYELMADMFPPDMRPNVKRLNLEDLL